MLEPLSWLALGAVIVLLAIGLTRQFAVVGPRGVLLDRLAIIPQWKFFGQAFIAADPGWSDDLCLLARISPDPETPGAWDNVLWWEDRPFSHAVWNPALRSRDAVGEAMMLLVQSEPDDATRVRPVALAYLTVLRGCLDRLPLADGEALQFAVAATRGRGERPVFLRFLSAWHTA